MELSNNKPSYWSSIFISTIIVGMIAFLFPIIFGYITISLEPSGSIIQIFVPVLGFCFACLAGASGGCFSVWHYARSNNITLKIGNGALIGFLTGISLLAFSTILDLIWNLIDPDFLGNLRDSLIAIIDATELPEEQKQMQIDSIANQYNPNQSFRDIAVSFALGIPIYGFVNLLTGMLGVSLFAKEKEI